MANAESTLETKLKQLERTEGKSSDVLKSGKRSAVSRHLTNLKELLTEVDNARRAFEAEKIAAKVSDEEINAWNDGIMAKNRSSGWSDRKPRRMVGETENGSRKPRARREDAI